MTVKIDRSRNLARGYLSGRRMGDRWTTTNIPVYHQGVEIFWLRAKSESETTEWGDQIASFFGEATREPRQLDSPSLSEYLNDSTEELRQRLANANDYFRRKATEVVSDDAALRLLATLYEAVVVDISEFDSCKDGLSLAKLTAANFCEIGANVIYITESGQRFIDSIKDA